MAWIVDEVSYMLPGSTKKQHKVLPKWEVRGSGKDLAMVTMVTSCL